MIHIDLDEVRPGTAWEARAAALTEELKKKPADERAAFIKRHEAETWKASALLHALRSVAGNKCWYSEVRLEGADPNVDHFRPKGRIQEVDTNLQPTKDYSSGYWWLAFELHNFRLSSMHSNQRRVDETTEGGKWDYFPVRGARTPECTEWDCISEDVLALDPCSASDVSLLWFDLEGKPCVTRRRVNPATPADEARVRATIWLYHLNKQEIERARARHVADIRKDLRQANSQHILWNPTSAVPDLPSKNRFDTKVAQIKRKLRDDSEFAGAKRSVVRLSISEFPWIDEYLLVWASKLPTS